jgi:type I restriction enzyme M protein
LVCRPIFFTAPVFLTCILVFKKCREQPEDVFFIDASNEFDKIKTQNILRDEHIDKIVSTYRNRTEIEKYSKRATLQEIITNDYNLNIPRYVDTFEAEEGIDIIAIAKELKLLDKQIKETDQKIAGFCMELAIETPF